ncbi:MAG: type II secretion system F family protein [Eubacterium sp.]|nr:type II secretion system F family protein [Eubacterium sp.]
MYWIAAIVVTLYVVLFLFSRKSRRGKSPPGILGYFYPMAGFLFDILCHFGMTCTGNKQVRKDLKALNPGADEKQILEEYFIKKIALSLMLCLVGTILAVAVSYSVQSQKMINNGAVMRGSYEDGEKELTISAGFGSGERKEFQVTVYPTKLSKEETEELYNQFAQTLPEMILGENTSLDRVTASLTLEEAYENYPFLVEWKSGQVGIVNSLGEVSEVEEAIEIVLTATITFEEWEWQQEIPITVIPPTYSEEEQREKELEEMLEISERDSRLALEWKLPASFQGEDLVWEEIQEDYGPVFLVGAFVIAILVFILADKDLHDEVRLRQEGMRRAYPDVVQKLVLYLGAGMTVRGAFQKIASEHEKSSNEDCKTGHLRSIYDEICHMCRELQAGVSEGTAYEHLGRRTGVQEYLRLSTLLSQNLKKGNSTLLQRLQEESEKAYQERLQNSRKLGEEASTKLLLPMIMFLVVVMLVVMLPAFSSVGI